MGLPPRDSVEWLWRKLYVSPINRAFQLNCKELLSAQWVPEDSGSQLVRKPRSSVKATSHSTDCADSKPRNRTGGQTGLWVTLSFLGDPVSQAESWACWELGGRRAQSQQLFGGQHIVSVSPGCRAAQQRPAVTLKWEWDCSAL